MASKKSKSINAASAHGAAAVSKAIRMCLDSGQVSLGMRTALSRALHGRGQLIVLAANAPADESSDLRRYCAISHLPLLPFEGTSLELGSVCGKPFPVSALWIGETGNSPILEFIPKA